MSWGKDIYELVRIPIKKACNGYYVRWWYNGWHYWFFIPGSYGVVTEGLQFRTISTRKIVMGTGQITLSQAMAIRSILLTREVYVLSTEGWMNVRLDPTAIKVHDNKLGGTEMEFTMYMGSKELSYATGFSPVTSIPEVPPDISLCELSIGSQIWACYNYDTDFPGSVPYDNLADNLTLFGRLYNWPQITTPGFAPSGWRVPTLEDWDTLITFAGGLASAGVLKVDDLTYWNAPNTDANNEFLFDMRGGGLLTNNIYVNRLIGGYYWTQTGSSLYQAYSIRGLYNSGALSLFSLSKNGSDYASVRLIKEENPLLPDEVAIGTQIWKTTNVDDNIVGSLPPNGDAGNIADYGRLYDFTMIPAIEALHPGYHVPTKTELQTLETYLGGAAVAGGHLKETGIVHWNAANPSDNSSGFTARGAGINNGAYLAFKQISYYWSKTEGVPGVSAWIMSQSFGNTVNTIASTNEVNFLSIRLIKD